MDTLTPPQTPPGSNANELSQHFSSSLSLSNTFSAESLVDQILSLIANRGTLSGSGRYGLSRDRDAIGIARNNDYFTFCHEFPGVSKAVYIVMMDQFQELRNTTIDFPKTLCIDYFAAESLLIIILPGKLHRIIAFEAQLFLRRTLFQQGFYWLASDDTMGKSRCTAADFNVSSREHHKSSFHLDGSLEIMENDTTFMAIEVVDGESYRYGRRKASALMKESNGKIRCVILIDLIRGISEGSGQQNDPSSVRIQAGRSGSTNQGHMVNNSDPSLRLSSKKRSRDEEVTCRSLLEPVEPEITADISADQSSSDFTHLPPMAYTRATVTVITSYIRPHLTLPGVWEGIITTPVDAVECWPAAPNPESAFSFTWDETSVLAYPAAMKGKVFTIEWGWLHALFQDLFEKPEGGCSIVPKSPENGDDVVNGSDQGSEMELDFDNP